MQIYDKTGDLESNQPTSDWFDDDNTLDERVLWDPFGQSYVTVNNEGNHLTITVSETSNPLGQWCSLQIPTRDGENSNIGDFPLVGVDPHFLWVSNDVYTPGGSLTNSRLNAIPRAALESCQASISYDSWNDLIDPGTSSTLAYHLDPATDLDGEAPSNTTESFFNVYGGGGSHLSIWWVNSTTTSLSGLTLQSARVAVPTYSDPPPVQEKGTSATLDPYVPTVNDAYVEPDGAAMIAWVSGYNWGSTTDDVVDWAQASADEGFGAPYVANTGSFGAQDYDYFYPAMGYDAEEEGVAAFSFGGSSVYPGSAFIGLDGAGDLGSFQYAYAGTYPYSGDTAGDGTCTGCSRWGDWQTVSMNEPGDHFWFTAELATRYGTGPDGEIRWHTTVSNITMND